MEKKMLCISWDRFGIIMWNFDVFCSIDQFVANQWEKIWDITNSGLKVLTKKND